MGIANGIIIIYATMTTTAIATTIGTTTMTVTTIGSTKMAGVKRTTTGSMRTTRTNILVVVVVVFVVVITTYMTDETNGTERTSEREMARTAMSIRTSRFVTIEGIA